MEVRADVPVTPPSGGSSNTGPVQYETKEWVVERRYSEFSRFHSAVKRRLPQLAVVPFPAKVWRKTHCPFLPLNPLGMTSNLPDFLFSNV
jgi:hypothetical protein